MKEKTKQELTDQGMFLTCMCGTSNLSFGAISMQIGMTSEHFRQCRKGARRMPKNKMQLFLDLISK